MRDRMKQVKKSQIYRDRIKLECFIDIAQRNIKK